MSSESPLRVGIDLRLYSYRPAGIANYALRLARELSGRPRDLKLLAYQSRKTRDRLCNARTRWLWTPCHHRYEQAALAVELFNAPIDILHSPDFIPPYHRRFRSVISVHDLGFHFFPEFVTEESKRYYGQIEAALSSADAVLVDAESTRRDLYDVYGFPKDKVTVTYLAADEVFRPIGAGEVSRFLRAHALPEEFLLWVGTIEPRKNVPGLLRAYAKIDSPPPLLIAGHAGWLVNDIHTLIEKLGIADSVHFFTPTSQQDLVYLYNAARALVMPSHYEGFGFPALEALSCGTPVVCSDRGSLPEIVGDAAVLIDPDDDEAIAAAVTRVLNDSQLSAGLKVKGFEQAAKFTWQKCAEETLAVYRQVAAA